jgi:Leucine-rich repeat (LRR) protein
MTSTSGLTTRISQTLFTSNSFVEEVASILQHWDTGLEAAKKRIQDAKETNSAVLDLQQMELTDDLFDELWPSICELGNLKNLNLFLNRYVPCSHRSNDCLTVSRLSRLPSNFGDLSTLETLSLACNPLESVPESFANLAMLRELDLGFTNTLSSFPEMFERMTHLKILYAGNNR